MVNTGFRLMDSTEIPTELVGRLASDIDRNESPPCIRLNGVGHIRTRTICAIVLTSRTITTYNLGHNV